jgi:ornithine cyclodeaminase
VLVLDAETVHRSLPYPQLVEALYQAHRAPVRPPIETVVLSDPAGAGNDFLALTAWAPNDVIAAKLVSVFPANLASTPPKPSVQGVVVLFDGADGAVRLVADGAAMTLRKTAADSALGVRLLSREDARVLAVIGAGALAPHVISAHTSVRPSIRTVLVWNRTAERARAVAQSTVIPDVDVRAVDSLDRAVASADIVSCVTMATSPLVRGQLLRPGAHIDLIGGYTPTMREADDDTIRRGRVFVDTRDDMRRTGDIAQPLDSGLLLESDIRGDLYDLCSGSAPGRTSPDGITVFKNVGGAHLDLFTARHLMKMVGDEARRP